MADDGGANGNKKIVLFNTSKKESHNPNNGYKKWNRRLRTVAKIQTSKEDISMDRLSEAELVVFGGSREPFTSGEFKELKQYLVSGGRIMILVGDGGEAAMGSNINYFLEEFGMSVNNDSVTRSAFYKYYHPKEVFIAEGVLVPDIARKKNSIQLGSSSKKATPAASTTSKASKATEKSKESAKMNFVYPYGASLNVQKPAIPLLSSGPISYPMNRPLAAMWETETVSSTGGKRGRLVVIGSAEIFGDDWIDKDENGKLCDIFTAWLLGEADLDMTSDRNESEIADYKPVPNIEALSDVLKPCLQGMDELPRDFTKLFDMDMFKFDFHHVPGALKLFELLGVQHEPLSLISPQFDCPLPKLGIATFPPAMREPMAPALDQFDLDEHFAKEGLRLAQLTNKCTSGEEDLDYYIAEAGEILAVSSQLPYGERSAKHILFHVFKVIVDCKKQEYTPPVPTGKQPVGIMTLDGKYDHRESDFNTSTHIGHVDLAPLSITAGRGNTLMALDPNLQLGGPAIGGSGKNRK